PCDSLVLEAAGSRRVFGGGEVHRLERGDVAQHFRTASVGRNYGLWLFGASAAAAASPLERSAGEACRLAFCRRGSEIARVYKRPDLVTDREMRDVALELIAHRPTGKNAHLAAVRDLEAGFGDELIGLNRRIPDTD